VVFDVVRDQQKGAPLAGRAPFLLFCFQSRISPAVLAAARVRWFFSKGEMEEKEEEGTGRRSVLLPPLSLNRHLRHPGHSSFAGLLAPLVLRGRHARSQLRQSGRSAVREMSSRKNEDRKGWQGAGPELS
jgi:hypothetical protein